MPHPRLFHHRTRQNPPTPPRRNPSRPPAPLAPTFDPTATHPPHATRSLPRSAAANAQRRTRPTHHRIDAPRTRADAPKPQTRHNAVIPPAAALANTRPDRQTRNRVATISLRPHAPKPIQKTAPHTATRPFRQLCHANATARAFGHNPHGTCDDDPRRSSACPPRQPRHPLRNPVRSPLGCARVAP